MSLAWFLLGLRFLATFILYTFLGLAFYIIWRDLKQAAQPPVERPAGLRVIAADGVALTVDQIVPLQPVTLLGCDPANTIVLDVEAASAHHARLKRTAYGWWLEDLGSEQGTRLNEVFITQAVPVGDGDVIGIGSIRLRLELA